MSHDEKIRAAIAAHGTDELRDEIDFRLDTAEEDGNERDLYRALRDAEEQAEQYDARAMLNAARRCLIDLGVYVELTPEQAANTQTTGRRPYDFKLGGKMYVFDRHLD